MILIDWGNITVPAWEHLLPFFTATIVFAALPGPALVYAAAQTMARGRRGGFMAAFGLHIGGLVHVAAAAAGLSAVFTHVPLAYSALKIIGALYLIWLGIGIIRSKFEAPSPDALHQTQQALRPVQQAKNDNRAGKAFLHSVTVEVLNPKTALFFIAFLPQFADASAAFPVWLQFLILGLIVNGAFTITDITAVLLTDKVLSGLRKTKTSQRVVKWMGGTMLVGLGAHLALSK